jgi:hypothetical protein
MDLRLLKLTDFTQRGLNFLGKVFGEPDARVLLSNRAECPLTVVLESRAIMLDPVRAGLFDLALGARLLRHRALRSRREAASDDDLTEQARSGLADQCRAQLRRDFPAVSRLSGLYQTGPDFEGLRVTTRQAAVRPLPPLDIGGPEGGPSFPGPLTGPGRAGPGTPRTATRLDYSVLPDIELTGADDDFGWLLDAISAGGVPLSVLPSLEDLPFVRAPFRICTPESYPGMEWLEESLRSPEARETIDSLIKCTRRKSEVRQERRRVGARTVFGSHLDTGRLVEAALTARAGGKPRPFRKKGGLIEPVFDPSEHLTVVALDLGDIWLSHGGADRFISQAISAFQQLDVGLVVLCYAGRLVRLPDGRDVLLHFTTVVKGLEDTADEAFWGRLMNLVHRPLALPGEPAFFHPLGLQDIIRQVELAERVASHSYTTIAWWARRWSAVTELFDSAPFLMRVADNVDYQVRELVRGTEGTLDTLPVFLPQRLRDHGRPGEFLSSVKF